MKSTSERKFVEFSSKATRRQKIEIKSDWFNICQGKQLPYIEIETYTKFCTVHFDYVNLNTKLDDIFFDDNVVRDELHKIYEKYFNEDSSFTGSLGVFYLNKIELDQGKNAAIEIFDYVLSRIKKFNTEEEGSLNG